MNYNFEKILVNAAQNGLFPGCVTECFFGNEIVHTYVIGSLNPSPCYGPTHRKAFYDIASITKVVVALAILCLIDRGKLRLDDTVASILPFRKRGSIQRMKIWNLLTCTADFSFSEDVRVRGLHLKNGAGKLRVYDETDLVGEPGEVFRYGNPPAFFQGKILESICEAPLPEVLKELVLDPLGMHTATFDPPHDYRDVAPTRNGSGWQYFVMQDPMSKKFLPEKVGISGIFATIEDIVRLVRFLATGITFERKELISRRLWKMMTTDQLEGKEFSNGQHRYGFGIDMPGPEYVSDPGFCANAVFMSGASGPFIFACPSWNGGNSHSYPIGGVILCNTAQTTPEAKQKGRIFRRSLVQTFLEERML